MSKGHENQHNELLLIGYHYIFHHSVCLTVVNKTVLLFHEIKKRQVHPTDQVVSFSLSVHNYEV